MGVYLKWRGDRLSPQWWGFWQADGKRHEVAVCRWKGVPPAKGAGKGAKGDEDFERSREEAERKFEEITSGERSDADRTVLVNRIHAARYGGKVERVRVDELAARWDALPHKQGMSEGWRSLVHCVLDRFATFMKDNYPKVTEAGALQPEHFQKFFEYVDGLGVSGRTWNYHLTILRGLLAKVDAGSRGFREYLARLPKKDEATVHRTPFSGGELEAVFAAADRVDPELRPVIVAAACTALRKSDVARLRWDHIDMEGGFVAVKTGKTGERVEIPIFPPLAKVLEEAEKDRKGPYVFPSVAAAHRVDRGLLDRRLQKVLAASGFRLPRGATAKDEGRKGTVAEKVSGEPRQRRGSLRGWHSFRTTFCSLALANGVPMEMLTRITGHRTAEIVEKHYNQAKREQMKNTFGKAMPRAIAGGVELKAGWELVAFPADRAEGARLLAECGEVEWRRALRAGTGKGKKLKS